MAMNNNKGKVLYIDRNMAFLLNGGFEVIGAAELLGLIFRSAGTLPIDRTGVFESRTNFEILDKIPNIENFNKNFSDICDARAQELLNKNKIVSIFWSGGIDSTTILVSFLKNITSKNQIKVLLCEDSIVEYPWFYKKYVKELNHEILDYYVWKYQPSDEEIVVDGNCGDQLFGSTLTSTGVFELKDKPWQELFELESYPTLDNNQWATNILKRRKVRDFMREAAERHIVNAPYEIKTVFDLGWWMNFTLRWQLQLRILTWKPFNKDVFDKTFSFFNTSTFQKWSMTNPDLKVKNTIESYKFVAKDYIYDFTKDNEYYNQKRKVNSASDPNKSIDSDINTRESKMNFIKKSRLPKLITNNFNAYDEKIIKKHYDRFLKFNNDVAFFDNDKLYNDNWISWNMFD